MGRMAMLLLAAGAVWGQATVPFVGCRSDGQLGPIDAPKGKDRVLPIPEAAANRLAYYEKEDGFAVLGPRGWYCFAFYGSGGTHLFVSPEPIVAGQSAFSGSTVVLAGVWGGTSGRFGVASVIARVFPEYGWFVDRVANEGTVDPPPFFARGPYLDDKLTYKSSRMVEYLTPAETEGLGLEDSWLRKNAQPIRGVAMLIGDTPDLLLLSVRLPKELDDFVPVIIKQVERETQKEVK